MAAPLLIASVLPLLALAVVIGLRHPMWLLAIYAAIVPWGSSYALPLGLPSSLSSVSTLAGVAASVGIVAHLLASRRRAGVLLPSVGLFLLFLGWAALTILWSVDTTRSVDQFTVLFSLVALFVVASFLAADDHGIELFERGIAAGGVIAGLAAALQLATGTLPVDGAGNARFELGGGGGENGDPNITAAILVLPFIVSVAHGLRPRTTRLGRGPWLAASGLIALAIALTASRGGLLGAAVGGAILAWAYRLRLRTLAALVAVLGAIGLTLLAGPGTLEQRFTESSGTTGRSDIWRIGVEACSEHCAIGAGWGSFAVVHEQVLLREPWATGRKFRFEPHNAWLGTAVEAGLPGVTLLLAGIAAVAVLLTRVPRGQRGPPLAGLVALVVTNTFLSNQDFKYFWLTLTYAAVVATSQRVEAVLEPPFVVPRPPVREDVHAVALERT